jgi:hypothetical protein
LAGGIVGGLNDRTLKILNGQAARNT